MIVTRFGWLEERQRKKIRIFERIERHAKDLSKSYAVQRLRLSQYLISIFYSLVRNTPFHDL